MVKEGLEVYWKDLLKATQKKIRRFYEKHDVTGLELVYASEAPILVLMVFDEGDLDNTDAMDDMVS